MTDSSVLEKTETYSRIDSLASYVESEVLDRSKRPSGVMMQMSIGEWYPSYKRDTGEVLTYLANIFSEVADEFTKDNGKKPKMLDLGSGSGVVVFTASATKKYEHCYGVEYNQKLVNWGNDHILHLEKDRVIPKNNTTLIRGSYYTQKYWDQIGEKIRNDPEVKRNYGDEYNDPRNSEHALESGGLLDQNGQLDVDVVYWYCSDMFLKPGADQWKNIFKKGTYLLLGPSGQNDVLKSSGVLEGFEHVKTQMRKITDPKQEFSFREIKIYRKK